MKLFIHLSVGVVFGILLGFFIFQSILHIASLLMTSDDDLNQATLIAIVIWPFLIILSAFVFYNIGKKNENTLSVTSFCILGALLFLVLADVILGLSIHITDWTILMSRELQFATVLVTWSVFSLFGIFITKNFLIKYLIKN